MHFATMTVAELRAELERFDADDIVGIGDAVVSGGHDVNDRVTTKALGVLTRDSDHPKLILLAATPAPK